MLRELIKENPDKDPIDLIVDFIDKYLQPEVLVKIKKLYPGVTTPTKATVGSACYDLSAYKEEYVQPNETKVIKTGLSIELPSGYKASIYPRSGLAAKLSISVLNSPGTIDSDYRGEIGVILHNHGTAPFRINIGDRVAQLEIIKVTDSKLIESELFNTTDRGAGGFGSTGGFTE